MAKIQEIGPYSAYALAVKYGYQGTEEEWVREQEASRNAAAASAEAAAQSAQQAASAADNAVQAGQQAVKDVAAAQSAAEQAIETAKQNAVNAAQAEADKAAASASAAASSAAEAAQSATNAAAEVGKVQSAGTSAVQAVQAAQNTATEAVSAAQQTATQAVSQAQTAAVSAVQEAGTTQTSAVESAGTAAVSAVSNAKTEALTQISAAGTAQVSAVGTAGTDAVEDVNDAKTAALEEIDAANAALPSPTQSDAGKVPTVKADGSAYELAGPYAPLSAAAAVLDTLFAAMLDGKNTTRLFWLWWPASDDGIATKYARLERWAKLLAAGWRDKTYTLRFYNAQTSGDYNGTPMDDLADGRDAAPLVTDASEPVEDWSENDPMTWYIRGNALSLADGTMNILALEGEDGFDVAGETAPVYCFAVSTCMKEWEDESYLYHSWRTRVGDGYIPMAGDVAPDNNWRQLTWRPAFHGGKNSAGGLTSGAGLPPMPWISASAALRPARQTSEYEGLWTDCDQQWVLSQWQLRHWTLSNSGKLEGCTSYNYQYTLAAAETGVKRVLVTTEQGANFLVGSGVCLGEKGANDNNDRNQSYNHDVCDWAKIVSIEEVTVKDVQYTALNFDLPEPINTTTTMLVSTMAWPSGTTEALQGHSDGCIGSLTSGKYPYRVAGVEMQNGVYTEGLDPLWQVSLVDDHWHYDVYSCRDSAKQASTITSDYEKTGEFDLPDSKTYVWNYIRALGKLGAEAMNYEEFGGSSSTYLRAAFGSTGQAGLRAPWRDGLLYDGGTAGLPCARGNFDPSSTYWSGVPRLAGSGKKRGEWQGGNET